MYIGIFDINGKSYETVFIIRVKAIAIKNLINVLIQNNHIIIRLLMQQQMKSHLIEFYINDKNTKKIIL